MIIDGKKEAALLREEIKKEITLIKEKYNRSPGLSVILIGDFAPSLIYVKNKEKILKKLALILKSQNTQKTLLKKKF